MTTNVNLGFVAAAGGTVDVITATYSPAPAALVDKMLLWFRATGANTSTTPTFSPNNLIARTIVKQGGTALVAGDIPAANAIMEVVYDATNTRWELVNPAHNERYKIYKALISQSGTDAPTVDIVLENTLGGEVVWTRNLMGQYHGTLVGGFTGNAILTQDKTVGLKTDGTYYEIYGSKQSNDVYRIDTQIGAGVNTDECLQSKLIEIRVYP